MVTVWELDFYSRPILDERNKKRWEVLISEGMQTIDADPATLFRYSKFLSNSEVNSLQLKAAIQEAIDQASWNGRLGNLLTNSVSRLSEQERQRVLHHEAGHFLVAYLLDIPVTDYTLNAWDAWKKGLPGLGGVQFDTTTLDETIATGQLPAQLLNRYCTIWMAGIAAEQRVYGQAQGGQDDRQKFSILWQQLQRPFQEGQMRQRWAVIQAQTLLDKHAAAYEALVTAMATGKSVEDCAALLQSCKKGEIQD